MKIHNAIDVMLLTLGTTYSLANIREVLGITILVLQIIWLLAKVFLKVYDNIKNKKTNVIPHEEIKDVDKFLNDINDKFDRKEDNDVDTKK